MTNPRMLAARMTAKPIDYGAVSGGTPGLGLTGLDIAGAMAMGGASRAETLMVLHKWVMDKSVQESLFYEVYLRVGDLAIKGKWKIPKGEEYLRRLTRLAIAEAIDPHCCPTCGGRREVWKRGATVPVVCYACNGIGRREWEARDRARACGISESSWSKTWGNRYRAILDVVGRIESDGLRALKKGVGNE